MSHETSTAATPPSAEDRSAAAPYRTCNPAISLAVAVGVVVCLLGTGQVERLPALGWAAAFLFFVIEQDVRTFRIPNWLNLSALLAVVIMAAVTSGLPGLGFALGGAALAFAILFPAFAMGWLGAGDVKAVMVLGALWGAATLPALVWWMIVTGGVLAVAFVIVRGGFIDLLSRWGRTLKTLAFTGRWLYIAPAPGAAAARGIPFAVAMGLGVSAHQLWGFSWI